MYPPFAPQCCDAMGYLELGHRCFAEGRCWHGLRPLGMALYASLPYRLGLPQESLIYFNLGLVLVSVILAARFIRAVWPATGTVLSFMRYPIALVPHVAFLWAVCFNSLSDAPAAALALSGLWLTCITVVERRGPVAAGASGLLLGLSAFVRLSYVYPVLLFGAVYAAIVVCRRRVPAANAMALLAALLAPLSLQVARTFAHTGTWSYSDPSVNVYVVSLHPQSALYGYDTIVPPWQGPDPARPPSNPDVIALYQGFAVGYDARSCFTGRTGLVPALRDGDVAGALCLLVKRQFFYFGSYARLGAVYLPSPETRVWSRWLCVINIVPVALTLYGLLICADHVVGVLVLVLLSSIWLVATVPPPEQRFFATVHISMWVIALATVWSRLVHHRSPVTPTGSPPRSLTPTSASRV